MSDAVYIRQGKSATLSVIAAAVVALVTKDFALGQCRLVRVNVIVAGTSSGAAYDSASPTIPTLAAPAAGVPTIQGSGGTFTAGTYYGKATALNPAGETVGSAEMSATVAANGTITWFWGAVPGATQYRLYRGSTAGGENAYFTTSTTTYVDTGAAGTAGSPPTSNTAYTNQVGAWPNAVGSYLIDMPCLQGILIVPGAGQMVSVSYD